jgi:hypothetical protein
MAWEESQSSSFSARHESADSAAARALLSRLEEFRHELGRRFGSVPPGVSVVMHPHAWQLGLAHPWLPLARWAAAPAARRYFAGWFGASEIHVLSPRVLEHRASKVPGSIEALNLTPLHEYAHVVVGSVNPGLPPPFNPGSFRRYLRWAWLCEGAATWLSGQVEHLRPAIVRRLREGNEPSFPPSARDAFLLGGTVFSLLELGAGYGACVELASVLDPEGGDAAIARAFHRPRAEVERDWRDYLSELTATDPAVRLSI